MSEQNSRTSSLKRKASLNLTFAAKRAKKTSCRKLISILQKNEEDRTPIERQMILDSNDPISVLKERLKKINAVKSRNEELEDEPDLLAAKCKQLARDIQSARHVVVYTGAGISTAAKIPDYRGTKGIWTLLQQGKDIGNHDLSLAEPTLTHMALYKLHMHGLIKHVLSQNCDDLHLRSGLPRKVLSEVHGNMSLEVCAHCEPVRYYWRVFDVTEHTGRFAHQTARKCACGEPLLDTIIHFGEKGVLLWPLNWDAANKNADKADLILCVGSSLKVLRKYGWLWGLDRPKKERPKLIIINLQWTPKDDQATLKINGKCDAVFEQVMAHLNLKIPVYNKLKDPIFYHSTHLVHQEYHTVKKPMLDLPEQEYFESYAKCDKLLESFRELENYQNTTVFVKGEDVEIGIKQENDFKPTSGETEQCFEAEVKMENELANYDEEIDEEFENKHEQDDMRKPSIEFKKMKSEIKAYANVENTNVALEEDELENKASSKIKIKDEFHDCSVSLTDVVSNEEELVEIMKQYQLTSINNLGNGIKEIKQHLDTVESKVQDSSSSDLFRKDFLEKTISVGNETRDINDSTTNPTISSLVPNTGEPENQKVSNPDSSANFSDSTGNIKNILKNFRRAKKGDQQTSSDNSDVSKNAFSSKEKISRVNTENSLCNPDTNCDTITSSQTMSYRNEGEIHTPLNSLERESGSTTNDFFKDHVSSLCLKASSSSKNVLSSTSLGISSGSSVLGPTTPPKLCNSASSFSTLVVSSPVKCECRSEMDLSSSVHILAASNLPCSCGAGRPKTKRLDASNVGKSLGSVVAIVKPILKESPISAASGSPSFVAKPNVLNESIGNCTNIQEPLKTPSKNSFVDNRNCDIRTIMNENTVNINPLLMDQGAGADLNNTQHLTHPILPSPLFPLFPNMVQPLMQSFLQPQPVLHTNQPIQQLLPFLMNGNVVSSNILAPPFSLTPPFLTGMSDPLQTPFQISTPQMSFNHFPNQSSIAPMIYVQSLPISPSLPQLTPSLVLCPPSVSTLNNISFHSNVLQSMVQPTGINLPGNMSNISVNNCVQSTFDNNVVSSQPNIKSLPALPLTFGQVSTESNNTSSVSQQSSPYVSSMLSSSVTQSLVNNAPIVDTGQAITVGTPSPSVSVHTSKESNRSTSGTCAPLESPSLNHKICGDNSNPIQSHQSTMNVPSSNTSEKSPIFPVSNQPSSLSTIVKEDSVVSSQSVFIPPVKKSISSSPLKSPTTPACSPRIISHYRSPVSPICTTLTSPLRRIRTIRPFQFNESSIPEDLMFIQERNPPVVENDLTYTKPSEFLPRKDDEASRLQVNKPFVEVFQSVEISTILNRPTSCPSVLSQDNLSTPSKDNEEVPQEVEKKKRGRKPKVKEEKPAEIYHYSLPERCEFCLRNYESDVCLFYERQSSLTLTGRRKMYCNCCTYNKKSSEEEATVTSVVASTNPGWFGKGYRKIIKRKRSI